MEENLSKPLSKYRINDRVALIESGEDAISVRLSLIENAQTSINLSYYKFADGEIADLILGSLLEAADRGVKVKILLDGIIQLGNIGKKIESVFIGFKAHPNIDVKLYEPFNPFLPLSWNNRLYDKMIIVDNKFALVGGRNIEDRFYLKELYNNNYVQDRDVLIYHKNDNKTIINKDSPSVVNDIQNYYEKLWHHRYTKPKHKSMSARKIKKGRQAIKKLKLDHEDFKSNFFNKHFKNRKIVNWKAKTVATNKVRFISNQIGRKNQDPQCLKAILQLRAESKNNIFIQSPYFIPSKSIQSLFKQYNIDLNKTTILTNSKASTPNIISIAAYKNYKKIMVDKKIDIYEFQGPGSIHAKTSIYDERTSVIGTFNIDPRSSYISTESIVIIDSEEFAKTVKDEVESNLIQSLKVGSDYTYASSTHLSPSKSSKIKNIMITILSKITPFIEYLL